MDPPSKTTSAIIGHNSSSLISSSLRPFSVSHHPSSTKNSSSGLVTSFSLSTPTVLGGGFGNVSSNLNVSTKSRGASLSTKGKSLSSQSFSTRDATSTYSNHLFKPIATHTPPSMFPREELTLSIPSGVSRYRPLQTNKFYSNLFLDDQTYTIWSYPYGMFWKKEDYYGFAVQHTDLSKRVLKSQDNNH